MIVWKHAKGAAIVIVSVWLVLLAAHGVLEYSLDTHVTHGHEHWGLAWATHTFENLQSEAWQVGFAAWVFTHFIWRGSPESKEG